MTTSGPENALVGRWLLDHREPDGASIYLPYDSFTGRPSRAPRPGLELRADGTFSWLVGGAADGHARGDGGRWQAAGPAAMELHPADRPPIRVEVAGGEPRSLRVGP